MFKRAEREDVKEENKPNIIEIAKTKADRRKRIMGTQTGIIQTGKDVTNTAQDFFSTRKNFAQNDIKTRGSEVNVNKNLKKFESERSAIFNCRNYDFAKGAGSGGQSVCG